MRSKPYLIGIVGGSGSGKSYFLHRLLEKLGKEQVCLVSQDNYYRPLSEHPIDANGIRNFDLPQSIDFDAFSSDIQALLNGKTVRRPEYTFNNPEREAQEIVMESRPAIIAEGLYIFHDERVNKHIDCKVFVDAHYPVMIRRRILRDYDERGYQLEDVLYRYENHVMPAFEKYISPLRNHADIVVPNNGDIEVALNVLSHHIKAVLE